MVSYVRVLVVNVYNIFLFHRFSKLSVKNKLHYMKSKYKEAVRLEKTSGNPPVSLKNVENKFTSYKSYCTRILNVNYQENLVSDAFYNICRHGFNTYANALMHLHLIGT